MAKENSTHIKRINKNLDVISLRGRRRLWISFTNRLRINKIEVWEALEPLLKQYLRAKKGVKN